MEKGGGGGGGALGVRRKPVTKRRSKGAGIARAVAEYLVSDSYLYAPLIDPPTMLLPPPPMGELSLSWGNRYNCRYLLKKTDSLYGKLGEPLEKMDSWHGVLGESLQLVLFTEKDCFPCFSF